MEPTSVLPNAKSQNDDHIEDETPVTGLVPLFRILLKAPPKGHDCKTCPICVKYGTQID